MTAPVTPVKLRSPSSGIWDRGWWKIKQWTGWSVEPLPRVPHEDPRHRWIPLRDVTNHFDTRVAFLGPYLEPINGPTQPSLRRSVPPRNGEIWWSWSEAGEVLA